MAVELQKAQKTAKYKFYFARDMTMTSIMLLLGYNIGVMSGAIIYIRRDLHINDVQVEILMGIINLYSLIGFFLAGRISDWIGRRYTITFTGAIFFLGAVLMGLFSPNYVFLMIGRFLVGVGVGFALMIVPIYTAEVSPTCPRYVHEISINYGIMLGYISNYVFSKLPLWLGWRLMLGVGVFPSVLIPLGVLALPESPHWLVMRGRLGDAHQVLQRISDSEQEAQQRLADIKSAAGISENCNKDVVEVINKQKSVKGMWKEMFITATPAIRHIIIVVISIHFFQQAVGLDSIVLYSPTIFEKVGIISDSQKLRATLGLGAIKTTSILIGTFLLDQFGRQRAMLLTSFGGLTVSLFTLSTCLMAVGHSDEKVTWAVVLSNIMMFSSVASLSIGAGPIAWVYGTEVLPLRLHAQGSAMGVVVNRMICGVISMTFLSLSKAITIGWVFFLYGTIATIGWIFFFIMLPETQGKTLEEMEESFDSFRVKPSPTA